MRLYNVEIFDPSLSYRSSTQVSDFEYSFDYLDIEKNDIKSKNIDAVKGDFVRITANDFEICGIISDVNRNQDDVEIQYKPISKLFDINVMITDERTNVEDTIADLFADYYIRNSDVLQTLDIVRVTTESSTSGSIVENVGINNMLDLVIEALTKYDIVCRFSLDPQNKMLTLAIGKQKAAAFTIEADLPNVTDKVLTIKEASESLNKVTIFNETDLTESVTYYKGEDDTVSMTPSSRIVPVVGDVVTVKPNNNVTFAEQAEKKAVAMLKPSKYDNLIEIECMTGDELIMPLTRQIGQECRVIHDGKVYETILTGIVINNKTRLIFGAIRLELTKMLKKRFRSEGTK